VYYNKIYNNSGWEYPEQGISLDTIAKHILNNLPSPLKDSIGIYEVINYSLEANFVNNFFIENIIEQFPANKPYYVIYNFSVTKENNNWDGEILISLPLEGEFSCIENIGENFRKEISNKVNNIFTIEYSKFDHAPYKLIYPISKSLSELDSIIADLVDCCDIGRDEISCNSCIKRPLDEFIDIYRKNIPFVICNVVDDPDYIENLPRSPLNKKRVIENINITVNFPDDDIVQLDEFITDLSQYHKDDISERFDIELTDHTYYYKYPRDCGEFETIYSQYLNDESDVKYFIGVINFSNEWAILFLNTDVNFNLDIANRTSDENLFMEDEYEAISETAESENICGKLMVDAVEGGCMNIIEGTIAAWAHKFNGEDYDEWKMFYNNEIKARKEDLNETQQHFNFLVYKHAAYIRELRSHNPKLINYTSDLLSAKIEICSESIHTMLDVCGLIEGVGSICDLANGVLYATEGEYGSAALSGMGSIPLAGSIAAMTKWGGKAWNTIGEPITSCILDTRTQGPVYCRLFQYIPYADGRIGWIGKESRLRQVMQGMEDMTLKDAHHILPWALKDHEICRFLAPSNWHINNPVFNGKAVPSAFHANHPAYNDLIERCLDHLLNENIINNNTSRELVRNKMLTFKQYFSSQIDTAISAATDNTGQYTFRFNEYFRNNADDIFSDFVNAIN
jgi:hypothetical protein